ncbi:hypothetical protein G3570_07430 [Balneolaceae bacterium YR4-1]|uniref:Surface antigen n=1 Tax=Halalkalibaculum roseum TaxID=2709311 RepID=A0A6M1SWB2_9BACT|nr:hypothetical protein [Halalkalibaculum roseum]NGP76458.1 hypothetical protein [Halalkalibaculum roseum]
MKLTIKTILLLLFSSSVAFAQSSGDDKEDEPFRNEPFFSKPVEELLKRPGKDTSGTDSESREYEYYLNNLNEDGIDLSGAIESGPYRSNSLYSVYPSLPMIHFNRVDALFLGLKRERMQWYNDDNFLGVPGINPHGMIGYSFGQSEWQYVVGLEKYLGRNNRVIIGGEYHSATTTDDYWSVGLIETSLTSFMGGYDFQDYYKQQGLGLYMLFRTRRLFEGGIAYNDDRYNSQQRETNWALFGAGDRYRPNPPVEFMNGSAIDTVNLSSISINASFNPKRLVLSKYYTFSLNGHLEFGDSGIASSDYSYTKFLGEMINYYNFERGGLLKHRLKIGSISGNAPLFKQFQLGGIGTMRALPYKSLPFASPLQGGNQMILSNTEVHFGSPSWKGGDWIDFDDFYISLFLDSGWAAYESELEDASGPFNGFSSFSFSDLKHNGGFGVGSSSIRAELAWDLNDTGRAPVFWIRFNPTF